MMKKITVYGCGYMIGKIFVDNQGRPLFKLHCIIQLQNLCARSEKFRDVMDLVIDSIKFI